MSVEQIKTDLCDIQHWLQAVSTHPSGLEAGIQQAQQALGLEKEQIDSVVNADFGIDIRRRLGIYHNGYFSRLLQCMRAEFSLLHGALSSDWFDEMALRYLTFCPPRSGNLNDLGASFPDFLESDRPDKNDIQKTPAFDFLISLARLERLKAEVGRGPGIETLDLSVFNNIEYNDFKTMSLVTAPSLKLLATSFDLFSYNSQSRRTSNNLPEQKPQYLAIYRQNYAVKIEPICQWQFEFLTLACQNGLNNSVAEIQNTVQLRFPDVNIYGHLPVWLMHCAEMYFFTRINYL